jgi:hypothetical protein
MARQVGHKQHLNTVDERMLIVMKEYVHLRKYFLLISKYIEYRTPANTANKNAVSKSNSRKLKPTNIAIPNNATVVPIKN